MKKIYIIVTLIIVMVYGNVHGKGNKHTVKIANVNDFVMEQHYKNGKYQGIEKALDSKIVDRTVWQWDKKHIERFNLVSKDVRIPDTEIQRILSLKEAVRFLQVSYPQKSSGWIKVNFILQKGKEPERVFILEVNGKRDTPELILSMIGIKNPKGAIEEVLIRPEALFRSDRKSAFVVREKYFNYRIHQQDSREWLKENLQSIYGVSILVLKGYSKVFSAGDEGDRVFILLDTEEILREEYVPSIVLGWKQGVIIAGD